MTNLPDCQTPKPVVLCILDGWGERKETLNNAIQMGNTPNWDRLVKTCPKSLLSASGLDVGLPDGQMGNSEVGHMTLGSGRVVLQDLPRIDAAIHDGSLDENPTLMRFVEKLKVTGGTCHLMGLLSPGGVHSHQWHMRTLAGIICSHGIPVQVHAFLDGRDTPPKSAADMVSRFEVDIRHMSCINIATVTGRYWAMDRDNRWDRVEKAYRCLVEGEGENALTALEAINGSYENDITDEFVEPTTIGDYDGMQNGDGILMANFRADRAREILSAMADPNFNGFARPRTLQFAAQTGMVEYSDTHNTYLDALFPQIELNDILGELIADAGMKQLHIAETEKYAHVTFFFNGGREEPFPGETRILVNSPDVPTYDHQPEMSAPEVTAKLVKSIESGAFEFIVVNYANGDMVGHTGVMDAAIQAVETVDQCVGRLEAAVRAAGGVMLITADHGNCEKMCEGSNPHTAHTLFPVPAVLVNAPKGVTRINDGGLADIAPTILALLGLDIPEAMTGTSLLKGTVDLVVMRISMVTFFWRVTALCVALSVCAVDMAGAQSEQNADKKLQSVRDKIKRQQVESTRQKERAQKLKTEMAAISKDLVAAAQKVQEQEAAVAGVEAELNRLEYTAGLKEKQLRERQQQFSGVMMALSRIARFPSEALIAQPIPPEDTVRSAILLRAAVPTIEQRANTLRGELEALSEARRKVDQQRQVVVAAVHVLREEENRIEGMRKKKAALRAEAISKSRVAQSKARKLAKKAKSLQDLISKLNKARAEAERKAQAKAEAEAQARAKVAAKAQSNLEQDTESKTAAPPTTNLMAHADLSLLGGIEKISKARGKLPFPAVGRLVGRYGQELDGGLTSKGLSLETRDGARVVAPFGGKVVFSGPFRGYGQLLIIDHGEGYHSLLAGLGRIDAGMNQDLVAGEPVGVMANDGGEAVLYVEFRRNNQPINPLPWLAQNKRIPQVKSKG